MIRTGWVGRGAGDLLGAPAGYRRMLPSQGREPAPRGPSPARGAHRHGGAWTWIAYGLPVGLIVAMVSIWFVGGGYIAAGDVSPLVRTSLLHELALPWNHQTSGTGAPSFATTAQFPEALCFAAARALGLPGFTGQWLLYALIAAGAAAAVSALCSVWLRSAWAVAFASTVSVANVYTLVTLPNPLPLLALAEIALLGALVLHAARSAPRRVTARHAAVAVLGTLPLCYLGANPPLLAVVAVTVLALLAVSGPLTGGDTRAALRVCALAVPVAVAANAWWLYPELLALHGGGGVSFTAQTDVQAWTWTTHRASLTNVLGLNASWAWSYPYYMPFAARMDGLPWSVLGWSLPLLALVGCCAPPGDRRTRRALRALGLSVLPVAFLCKGLHPPLTGLSTLIYRDVPGMWLFREPMAKFGDWLVLVYALLAGAAVERALGRALSAWTATRNARKVTRRAAAAVLATAIAALCYPWPLWTAALVAAPRGILPAAQVHVPAGWQDVADAVDRAPRPGKVLELPLDTYYQISTTWGYHGVDDVPQQLIRRPVLQELPGGYFGATPQIAAMLDAAQGALVARDTAGARRMLDALGAAYVLVRRDLRHLPGDPPQPEVSRLEAGLSSVPGARRIESGPLADVFELAPGGPAAAAGDVAAKAGVHGSFGDTPDQFAAELASRDADTLLTDDPSAPVDSADVRFNGPASVDVDLARAGRYALSLRSTDAEYQARVQNKHGKRSLVLSAMYETTVAGQSAPDPAPVRIPLAPPPASSPERSGLDSVTSWAIAVHSTSASGGDADRSPPRRLQPGIPVRLSPGDRVTAYEVAGAAPPSRRAAGSATVPAASSPHMALLPAGPVRVSVVGAETTPPPKFGSQVQDCNRYDGRSPAAVGLSARERPQGTFTLTAAAHAACIIAPVETGAVGQAYQVSFEYRTASGYPARFCVWEDGPGRCAAAPALTASASWQRLSTLIQPDPGTTGLRLYLYADGEPDPTTLVQYRAIQTHAVVPVVVEVRPLGPAAPVPANVPAPAWNEIHSGAYQVELSGVRGQTVISLDESYDPRWSIGDLPAGWSARHFTGDGYANAWVVTGNGSARLEVAFGPDRTATYALWVSVTAIGVCVLVLLALKVSRRRRRRPRTGNAPPSPGVAGGPGR